MANGRVWRPCGSGPDGVYGYDQYGKTVAFGLTEADTLVRKGKAIPLEKVRDYPAAEDPRLPYVFDLHWDAKTVNALRREMAYDVSQASAMLECLRQHVPASVVDLSGDSIAWSDIATYFRNENDRMYEHYLETWGKPKPSTQRSAQRNRVGSYYEGGPRY